MTRFAPFSAGLLLACAVACASKRPLPAPTDALTDSPDTLHAPAWKPALYAVAWASDLVVPSHLTVVRNNVWGTGSCTADTCVLAHVQPDELLELVAEEPGEGTITALPLPEPHWLYPKTPLTLELVPPTPDDPRGPIADAQFAIDGPARVTLDWRTTRPDGSIGPPLFIGVAVFGPDGSQHASVQGQFDNDPTRRAHTFELPEGSYRVRIEPDPRTADILCDPIAFPGAPPPKAPDWCALDADDGPYHVILEWTESADPHGTPTTPEPVVSDVTILERGITHVTAGPRPGPTTREYPVLAGHDVVVRWTPADTPMMYEWKVHEDYWSSGVCEDHACRFHAAPFSTLTMELGRGETDRTVELEVVSLPLPEPRFTLEPGYIADTTLARVTPDDPRGPVVDFLVSIPAPGRYRVGVGWTDGESRPSIEPLTQDNALEPTYLELFTSEPYDAEIYDIQAAGTYPFRAMTCPDCAEQAIQVEVQLEE